MRYIVGKTTANKTNYDKANAEISNQCMLKASKYFHLYSALPSHSSQLRTGYITKVNGRKFDMIETSGLWIKRI